MSHPEVKKIIEGITTGKKADIRTIFEKVVSEKAIDALGLRKIEIAKNFFGPVTEEKDSEEVTEARDPRTGIDPKLAKKEWKKKMAAHDKRIEDLDKAESKKDSKKKVTEEPVDESIGTGIKKIAKVAAIAGTALAANHVAHKLNNPSPSYSEIHGGPTTTQPPHTRPAWTGDPEKKVKSKESESDGSEVFDAFTGGGMSAKERESNDREMQRNRAETQRRETQSDLDRIKESKEEEDYVPGTKMHHRREFSKHDRLALAHHKAAISANTEASVESHLEKFKKHYALARTHLYAYKQLTGRRLKGKLVYQKKTPGQ